jgi:2-keto-4-pentenoate hydratase/2-oxohepta-3-ene-1,7-dioic acid hydratase in catechol pathway
LNYTEHIEMEARLRGKTPNFPTQPDVGYRAVNALVAHQDAIEIPADATERVEYEGELVCVVGREARHLTPDNALDCLLGFTIGNDVSERTWQASDRTLWRAKNTDTFKPMGPWIETDLDLDSALTRVRVNGKQCIEFRTNNMLFGVIDYLVAITRYITLVPGDVLWMGTEGHAEQVKDGDVVDIEIAGIGTLSNTVRRLARCP